MNKNQAKVLTEVKKTLTRVSNNGCKLEDFHYGFKQPYDPNTINCKPEDTECETKESHEEDSEEEQADIKWEPEKVYMKLFPGHLSKLAKNMSAAEMRIILLIPEYLSYQSGQLKKSDSKPLTIFDIEQLTELTKKTINCAMKSLVGKRILFRGRTGSTEHDPYQFYANPYIFFMGKYINPTLIDMFKEYKKPN